MLHRMLVWFSARHSQKPLPLYMIEPINATLLAVHIQNAAPTRRLH